jgi:hypothetical protein
VTAPRFLPLVVALLALAAPPAARAEESWSDADVEAAERYRAAERERAARYRTEVESASPAEPEAGAKRAEAKPTPRRSAESGAPLGDRLAARAIAWLEELLSELVREIAGWFAARLEELVAVFEAEPESERAGARLAPQTGAERERGEKRRRVADWTERERQRARDLLEGLEAPFPPPDPASEREWARREAERERALHQREAAREWQREERERFGAGDDD